MQLSYEKNKLEALCDKYGINLLVLHGSYAKDTATPESDIDIGILGSHKADYKVFNGILNDFSDIFGDKFDPVMLNQAEPLICYQVALSGKPLFEKRAGSFAAFRVQSLGRFFDTKKFRDLEKNYIKKAVGKPTS